MDEPLQTDMQDILKYLEEQEKYGKEIANGGEEGWGEELQQIPSGVLCADTILNELVDSVVERACIIEEFEAKVKAHNQSPLFDLSTKIKDFYIDDDMYHKLCFRENLIVSVTKEECGIAQPVGGLCCDVQLGKGKNPLQRKLLGLDNLVVQRISAKQSIPPKDMSSTTLTSEEKELRKFEEKINPSFEMTHSKFLVHVSSMFGVDERTGGSRITAWVDRNFHTLEEKRDEYIEQEDGVEEKKLYVALQGRQYFVRHKSEREIIDNKRYYNFLQAKNYIGEGANVILMRYLALMRYMGTFEMATIYINGDLCRNIYDCSGPESGIVNGDKLDICKIRRTIIEECGIVHNCITILRLNGQLIKQEWKGCDYVLQINPLSQISDEKPSATEHLVLRKMWETDMQLFSNYLDYKTTCHLKSKSYLADHPEFKRMMADYVQATLLMKPDEILDFTINHFTKYYPGEKPALDTNKEYWDEEHPYI